MCPLLSVTFHNCFLGKKDIGYVMAHDRQRVFFMFEGMPRSNDGNINFSFCVHTHQMVLNDHLCFRVNVN